MIVHKQRLPPKSIWPVAKFPEFDGAVLATTGAKLIVGAKSQAPDRAVMTLPYVELAFASRRARTVPVPDSDPCVLVAAAGDIPSVALVQRQRHNIVGLSNPSHKLARHAAAKETGLVASSYGNGFRRVAELAGSDRPFELCRGDQLTGAEVKPSDMSILAGSHQCGQIFAPQYTLDGTCMATGTDLICR